ncbi:cytochrome P450 [Russula aff. rugulosa BPL654]|nr:cytochrome P450 [Russula aff. rugulosa BPL654]
MSSSSASSFGLLEGLKSSLLQPWLRAKDRGILSIGVVLGFVVFCLARYLSSPFRKLPPGPRGFPIIGNILEMKTGQWLKFAEWHKKYGDLIYLNAAGQPIVVINSQKAAVELLDRRAAIYSNRPRNVIGCEIMTGGHLFGFSQYGETWRRLRRATDEGLNKNAVKGFYETQMTEAVLMADGLLGSPAQWDQHFRRAATSMSLSVLYGYPTLKSEQDHNVEAINNFAERLLKLLFWVLTQFSFSPGCDIFLAAKWKRDAEAGYKKDTAMFEGFSIRPRQMLYECFLPSKAKGDDHKSIASTLIREAEKNKLSSIERAWVGAAIYVGGSDSISAMMAWWMLAMLAYPETQARAYAELDAVVGRSRLPTFADLPYLPYIRATVRHTKPPRMTGTKGNLFRKGTVCIPNVWHMNRDPEIFGKNPEHFDPTRYLDASGKITPGISEIKDRGHFTYGFGRRICVGRYMADNALFINIVVLLWAAKIGRKKDASGSFVPLDLDGWVDVGLVVRPVPFEFEIAPRFREAPAMLAQDRELRGL